MRSVEPAIDWGLQRVLWEHEGNVVWVFGRGAPHEVGGSKNCAADGAPAVEIVSTKRFCRDLERGVVSTAQAWVGLLSVADGKCSAVAGESG